MAFKGTYSSGKFTIKSGDGTLNVQTATTYDANAADSDTAKINAKNLLSKGVAGYFQDTTEIDATKLKDVTLVVSEKLATYSGGKGADKVTTSSATLKSLKTNAGKDEINISSADSSAEIDAGAGDDKVEINTAVKNVTLGAGNDNLNLTANANLVDAGVGNDNITIGSSSQLGTLTLGKGNDIAEISGTVTNINAADGGKNTVTVKTGGSFTNFTGGTGIDSVIVDAQTSSVALGTIALADGANYLEVGSNVTVADVSAGKGADKLVVKESGTITKAVLAAGADAVTVKAGANATVDLGDGNDTAIIEAGSTAN